MTRHESPGDLVSFMLSIPLEVRGPLRRFECPAEDAFNACLPLQVVEALGEDIRELGHREDANEQRLAILNNFVGEVLLDVDVLGSCLNP